MKYIITEELVGVEFTRDGWEYIDSMIVMHPTKNKVAYVTWRQGPDRRYEP